MKIKNIEKKIKRMLLIINTFNKKQWFVVSLISTTSGVWFSLILNFWGNDLKLTYHEGDNIEFTLLGAVLTTIAISWSCISIMAQRYSEYHNNNLGIDTDLISKAETIYETLENSITSINEKIVSEKIAYVDKIKMAQKSFPKIYVKPCVHLNEISNQLRSVLSKLLTTKEYNIREKDIVVNIFYKFCCLDNVWHRSNNGQQQRGIATRDLTHNNTTFSQCLASNENYVYYHNKKEAYNAKHYVPDELDGMPNEPHYLEGSILCRKFSIISNDNTYIDIVVAIATYGKKFSRYDDEETQNTISYNIKHNILNEYEPLIKDALCDLYIQQEHEIQRASNATT